MKLSIQKLKTLSNVRSSYGEDELIALAQSLVENGQQVPLTVWKDSDGLFVIRFGHRRFLAAQRAGLRELDVVVVDRPQDVAELLISQVVENEYRQGMSYMDKAHVYHQLKEYGWKQVTIAQKFGVSETEVSLAIAATKADKKLQEALNMGRIKPSAVEPLLSQPLDVQAELADAAIAAKTVRKVTDLIQMHKKRRDIQKVSVQVSDIPDNVDPIDALSMAELGQALEHLGNVEPVISPELVSAFFELVDKLRTKLATLEGQPA